jgi:hypothetical protein
MPINPLGGGSSPIHSTPGATGVSPASTPTPASSGGAAPLDSGSSIAGGLEAMAPTFENTGGIGGADYVRALAKKDKAAGENVIDILVKPTQVSSTEVKYKLSGRKLAPGTSIYMAVPKELAKGELSFMTVTHGALKSEDSSAAKDGDGWDSTPALTSVQVFASNVSESDGWRYWGGPSSGEQGAKFAEFRTEPENLYEWKNKGHVGVKSGKKVYEDLNPAAIRVRSVGQDPVHIYEITLKIAPPKASGHQDVIFTPGASLGDVETHKGAKYDFSHTYPGALQLNGLSDGGPGKAKLPEGWKIVSGNLEIPLPAGKKLSFVDVACGDVHQVLEGGKYVPQKKSSGDIQRGYAKLAIGLKKASGQVAWFMSDQNVPSKGILTGAPNDPSYVIQPGDKVIVRSSSDTTHVMGVRVGTAD